MSIFFNAFFQRNQVGSSFAFTVVKFPPHIFHQLPYALLYLAGVLEAFRLHHCFSFSDFLCIFAPTDIIFFNALLLKSPSEVYALISSWSNFYHVSPFNSIMHLHVSPSDSLIAHYMHYHMSQFDSLMTLLFGWDAWGFWIASLLFLSGFLCIFEMLTSPPEALSIGPRICKANCWHHCFFSSASFVFLTRWCHTPKLYL